MSKKFIEVTVIENGREPQRSLIDIDLITTVTEIVVRVVKTDSRVNCVVTLAQDKNIQVVPVAETFNEIRNRLAAALS